VRHDPATGAAAYLAGELTASEHEAFEDHLLACDDCWSEVHAARPGRRYALLAREHAPQRLHQRIVDTVHTADAGTQSRRMTRVLVAAALVFGMLAGAAIGILATRQDNEQPEAIAAAVTGYLDSRLPGSGIPQTAAPNLSGLRLIETAAASGNLDGFPVTAYVYRHDSGRRLIVYVAPRQFPLPYESEGAGASGLWVGHEHGVTILCGRHPQHTLIIGDDERLVRDTADALHMT
jgi:hypothetical protein